MKKLTEFHVASEEFIKLCKKYPCVKFIGNTKINVHLIDSEYKKNEGWIYGGKDQKKVLFPSKKYFIFYGNIFNGK